MRKLFALVIALALMCPAALADVDLDSFTFQELRTLYRQVMREMVTRPEWQEAQVHPGIYIVGEDIPEGSYTISLANPEGFANIFLWGKEKGDYSTDGGLLADASLYDNENVLGKITLNAGNILEITGSVIISPVKGIFFK